MQCYSYQIWNIFIFIIHIRFEIYSYSLFIQRYAIYSYIQEHNDSIYRILLPPAFMPHILVVGTAYEKYNTTESEIKYQFSHSILRVTFTWCIVKQTLRHVHSIMNRIRPVTFTLRTDRHTLFVCTHTNSPSKIIFSSISSQA